MTGSPSYQSQSGGGGGGGVTLEQALNGAAEQRPPGSDFWRPARSWHTSFKDATRDALIFDISNASYTTDASDGGRTAIHPTALNVAMPIMLKAGQSGRNWDVRVRYRSVSASPHTSSLPTVFARYLGVDDLWQVQKSFNPAQSGVVTGRLRAATVNSDVTSTTADPDTTATTTRLLRLRCLEDAILIKSWIESAGEPDWQIVNRNQKTADIVEFGSAGASFLWVNTDVYVSEVTLTEIVRSEENLLWNTGFELIDASTSDQPATRPLYWNPRTTPTNGSYSFPDVVDYRGITRRCLQVAKATTNSDNGLWTQDLYALHRPGPTSVRRRNVPTVYDFPKAVDFSFWSKGTNCAHDGAGTLSATYVMYYSDYAGNGLNTGQPDYFGTIGPNAFGRGTWDWRFETHRIHIENYEKAWRIQPSFGLHDATATGTLQILDPVLRPVP